jgi:hypothetical protein
MKPILTMTALMLLATAVSPAESKITFGGGPALPAGWQSGVTRNPTRWALKMLS